MINIQAEQFAKALNKADESTRLLMGKTDLIEAIEKSLESLKLSAQADNILLPFGYYLLDIIDEKQLTDEILSLGVESGQISALIADVRQRINGVQPTADGAAEITSENIAHTKPEVSPVSPVRTMAADMQNAKEGNTYTSSQEHILNNPETTPTPTSPDDARWQSTN